VEHLRDRDDGSGTYRANDGADESVILSMQSATNLEREAEQSEAEAYCGKDQCEGIPPKNHEAEKTHADGRHRDSTVDRRRIAA